MQAKNVQTGTVLKAVSAAEGQIHAARQRSGHLRHFRRRCREVKQFEQKGVTVAAAKALELGIKLEEGTQFGFSWRRWSGDRRGPQTAQSAVRPDAAHGRRQARSFRSVVVSQ